jgi:SAM-dependent methyltransferase
MSFVSTKVGQFRYFDQQLGGPIWRGKKVLDFGGNCGNLLRDSRATIDHDKYWCIDVSRDAILEGKETFPKAHWIFYNRHNFQFNPEGLSTVRIPDPGEKFDFILAYSVFTHTTKAEMIDLVAQLRDLVTEGGSLAFTFLDPQWIASNEDEFPGSNLKWRLQVNRIMYPEIDIDSLLDKSTGATWVTLIDHELFVDDDNGHEREHGSKPKEYIVFCDPRHMKAIFPDAEILLPAPPERHHCCVIKKT